MTMATELEEALFAEELKAVRDLPEATRWQLERDVAVSLGLHVIMYAKRDPDQLFKARIRWDDYFGPPSLKFIDLASNVEVPHAWPKCFGFRPSSLDACLPWTEEGHKLHPEWRNSIRNSFPKIELPMQYLLLTLQTSLDNTYEGRGTS